MMLPALMTRVALVVGAAIGVVSYATIGPSRLAVLVRTLHLRLRATAPYLGLLAGVLLVNRLVRGVGAELSWLIGWNATGAIYAVEGAFVAWLQSFAAPSLTAYFSATYVYGYVLLLVFPLVAYLALDDLRPLRTTAVAYATNYAVGLVCYVLFIAYGPRNLMPELVDPLLFTSWPESKLLTSQVNVNTNVFPSLHSSLSATVALLAYRTREEYPVWFVLALLLAASIVVSTMYLGIHWLTDVVAGVVLAAASVAFGSRVTSPAATPPGRDTLRGRVSLVLRRGVGTVRGRLRRVR